MPTPVVDVEQVAKRFYAGLLGIPETPKPPELAKRGGAWFESGLLKIHLGVEIDFRPACKAPPALLVTALEQLVKEQVLNNVTVTNDNAIEGYFRVFIPDPFGN